MLGDLIVRLKLLMTELDDNENVNRSLARRLKSVAGNFSSPRHALFQLLKELLT
jgi:hypothetical protein